MSTLEPASLDETIRCASKWFILTQRTQNLEFFNLKCITYAQPIPLSLIVGSLKDNPQQSYGTSNDVFTKQTL